jgi:hypothetical protein
MRISDKSLQLLVENVAWSRRDQNLPKITGHRLTRVKYSSEEISTTKSASIALPYGFGAQRRVLTSHTKH